MSIKTLKSLSIELDELQDRLELALTAARIGIWDWDLETDELIWDANMLELFEIKKEDFDNTYADFFRALVPEDALMAHKLLNEAIKNKTPYDYCYKLNSGKSVRGRGKCYYRMGKPVRFVGVCLEGESSADP